MSLTLRVLCVVGSAVTFYGITSQIRRSKIKIEDSIFWVLFSGLLLLVALVPGIASMASRLLGFQAPSNLVFCGMIAILLIKEFHNTMQISLLKHKVNELAQELALEEQSVQDKGRRRKA